MDINLNNLSLYLEIRDKFGILYSMRIPSVTLEKIPEKTARFLGEVLEVENAARKS